MKRLMQNIRGLKVEGQGSWGMVYDILKEFYSSNPFLQPFSEFLQRNPENLQRNFGNLRRNPEYLQRNLENLRRNPENLQRNLEKGWRNGFEGKRFQKGGLTSMNYAPSIH